MKAHVGNGHVEQAHVPVTFTGTRTDDKRAGKRYKSVLHEVGLIPRNVFKF